MKHLTETQKIKLMIIENYIDHYTSDDEERDAMKENALMYVEEDYNDEIEDYKPSINNTNEPFKNVKVINTDGLEAETISIIEPIMLYSGDYEENETTFVVLHNSKGDTIRIFPERIELID
jgi:hypothetical protein